MKLDSPNQITGMKTAFGAELVPNWGKRGKLREISLVGVFSKQNVHKTTWCAGKRL